MRLIVCDTEVFSRDYIAVFYDISANAWSVFHNDCAGVDRMLSQPDCLFVGFNIKHYDRFILQAMASRAKPELVKEISDFIIKKGRPGWEHWYIRSQKKHLDICDLADDTQTGTSLKSIEGHLGEDIEETEVDFCLDRSLTENELQKTIQYCINDVKQTARLLVMRKNYLQGKIDVGKLKGIPAAKALSLTNAKLTALFLEAKPVPRTDERQYVFPSSFPLDKIPETALSFFRQIRDYTIPAGTLFQQEQQLDVGGCPTTIAWGGIHGAIPHCLREACGEYIILNYDVASLYPSLMIFWNYISRNIPDGKAYTQVYWDRLEAKAEKNKRLSNTLKLILNTAFGAMLNPHNALYDPLMARFICITGQLFMLDLAFRYLDACPDAEILQLNTDGIMLGIHPDLLPRIQQVNREWEERSHLTLEEDRIQRYVARDVNNYILRKEDGTVKKKGWLTWGVSEAGAFKVNNNYPIVKLALCRYFLEDIPIERTIAECVDIRQFQLIAKAGGNYESVYLVPGEYMEQRKAFERGRRGEQQRRLWSWSDYTGPRIPVQRVNRVYAVRGLGCGLIKVKSSGEPGRIANLPDSFRLDNQNKMKLEEIDKSWYIQEAKRVSEDFYG